MKAAAGLGISLLKVNINPIVSAAGIIIVNCGSDPAVSNSLPTSLAPVDLNTVKSSPIGLQHQCSTTISSPLN